MLKVTNSTCDLLVLEYNARTWCKNAAFLCRAEKVVTTAHCTYVDIKFGFSVDRGWNYVRSSGLFGISVPFYYIPTRIAVEEQNAV